MNKFEKFLLWEAKSRDTIDFKKVYVDIAGDLIAGLLLSQIIYWYLPDEHGQTKLRVQKRDHLWIAKGRDDWWNEIRITAKQFDRASNILIEKGIIAKDHFRFDGLRMVHIRLDYDRFMELWQAQLEPPAITQRSNPQLPKGQTRNYPKVKPAITQRSRPLTETTPETTADLNGSAKNSQTQNGEDGFDRAEQAERDNLNFIANQLARVTKITITTADEPTKERLKKAALLGYHLAEYCQISLSKLRPREINGRWQYSKTLESFLGDIITLVSDGVTPEDLKNNKTWWYNEYWLGRDKHQPPTSAQVCEKWGQFEAQREINVPAIDTSSGFYV